MDGAQDRTSQKDAPRRTEETRRVRLQASGPLGSRKSIFPGSQNEEPTAGYVHEIREATGPAYKPTTEEQDNLDSPSQQQPRPAKPSLELVKSTAGPRKRHGEIAPRRTEQNKAEPQQAREKYPMRVLDCGPVPPARRQMGGPMRPNGSRRDTRGT